MTEESNKLSVETAVLDEGKAVKVALNLDQGPSRTSFIVSDEAAVDFAIEILKAVYSGRAIASVMRGEIGLRKEGETVPVEWRPNREARRASKSNKGL